LYSFNVQCSFVTSALGLDNRPLFGLYGIRGRKKKEKEKEKEKTKNEAASLDRVRKPSASDLER
jgi:hypothetical protein